MYRLYTINICMLYIGYIVLVPRWSASKMRRPTVVDHSNVELALRYGELGYVAASDRPLCIVLF